MAKRAKDFAIKTPNSRQTPRFNINEGKTLLYPKKLLAFLRPLFIFLVAAGLSAPVFASAFSPTSMLSIISNAFFQIFESDVIEETATVSVSQNTVTSIPFISSAAAEASLNAGVASSDVADPPGLSIVQNSAIVSPLNPQGVFSDDVRGQITTYTIKEGDSITAIAQSFGITVNTLLWANNIQNARLIKSGDTLVILPVSGVRYVTKKGDTLSSIAKKFKGSVDDIASFNGLAIDEMLAIGTELIIPDGELQEAFSPASSNKTLASRFASLPEIVGYYLRPVVGGRNSRATKSNPHGIHGYNGVDLATSCGTPVTASAHGTVLIARTGGWNGGYGNYVVIAHPNGTQTLYGHMKMLYVTAGQVVVQGQQIGQVGSSGNSTGCHVHFEIRGAKNQF